MKAPGRNVKLFIFRGGLSKVAKAGRGRKGKIRKGLNRNFFFFFDVSHDFKFLVLKRGRT